LERKEEHLLKDIYDRYSDQLSKYAVTEEDAKDFKEKVSKLIAEELNSFSKFTPKEPEGKPDKILEKLEYNQLKMKEKLNRHYELLK
jgi:Mn-dependent DtxR family transcriptional regulator